jgi:hypothetical protein
MIWAEPLPPTVEQVFGDEPADPAIPSDVEVLDHVPHEPPVVGIMLA